MKKSCHAKNIDAWRGLRFADHLKRNETKSEFETIRFEDIDELIEHRNWQRIKELVDARIYEKPPTMTAGELISFFQSARDSDAAPDISITYGLDDKCGLARDGRSALYRPVICSENDLNEPIGFASFGLFVPENAPELEDTDLWIMIDLTLTYVREGFRGLGYGFVLADYCAERCFQQLQHVAGQLKETNLKVRPLIHADFESEGGDSWTAIFDAGLTWRTEITYDEKECPIRLPEVDAGY